MKTPIKKIFLIAAALVFFSGGVSFAHDWNLRPENNHSRWHDRGRYFNKPGNQHLKYKTYNYVYRNPGYVYRPYYKGHYYPQKYYRPYNHYRRHKGYPTGNTFFFGFSVR